MSEVGAHKYWHLRTVTGHNIWWWEYGNMVRVRTLLSGGEHNTDHCHHRRDRIPGPAPSLLHHQPPTLGMVSSCQYKHQHSNRILRQDIIDWYAVHSREKETFRKTARNSLYLSFISSVNIEPGLVTLAAVSWVKQSFISTAQTTNKKGYLSPHLGGRWCWCTIMSSHVNRGRC